MTPSPRARTRVRLCTIPAAVALAVTASPPAGAARQGPGPIVLRGHELGIAAIAISPRRGELFTAGLDGTVRSWRPPKPSPTVLLRDLGEAYAVAVSPDGGRLAASSYRAGILIVDPAAPARGLTLAVGPTWCGALAWSPDGRRLAAGCMDARLRIWDAASGRMVRQIERAGGANALAWSPDGSALATPAGTWDAATGARRTTFTGHQEPVRGLAYAPDGRTIATASLDKTIRLWDAATGASRATLRPFGLAIPTDTGWVTDTTVSLPQTAVAFSPDGRRLATAGADRLVRLWEVATGREIGIMYGHAMTVTGLAFLDDRRIASVALDGTVRIWDAERELRPVRRP